MFTSEQVSEWRSQVAEALEPERFNAWLQTKTEDDYLGLRRDCESCIIATYLNELLPHLDISVGMCQVFVDFPPHFIHDHIQQGGEVPPWPYFNRLYYQSDTPREAGGYGISQFLKVFLKAIDSYNCGQTITLRQAKWCYGHAIAQ